MPCWLIVRMDAKISLLMQSGSQKVAERIMQLWVKITPINSTTLTFRERALHTT